MRVCDGIAIQRAEDRARRGHALARHGPGMPRRAQDVARREEGGIGASPVRVDRWDETALLTDKKVRFQLQVALVASDGEVLWSGGFGGEVKSGGLSAAPRDRELMARSCAELVANELLENLPQRKP